MLILIFSMKLFNSSMFNFGKLSAVTFITPSPYIFVFRSALVTSR